MAYVLETRDHRGMPLRRYNIDAVVGRNPRARNLKLDVKLVQVLLKIFYYELGGRSDSGTRFEPPAIGGGDIAVDGIHGPVTQAHIDTFLDQLRKYETEPINNDHGFDPMSRKSGGLVVHGRRVYLVALVWLNDYCFRGDGLRSMPLEARSDIVPVDLAAALKTVYRHG